MTKIKSVIFVEVLSSRQGSVFAKVEVLTMKSLLPFDNKNKTISTTAISFEPLTNHFKILYVTHRSHLFYLFIFIFTHNQLEITHGGNRSKDRE